MQHLTLKDIAEIKTNFEEADFWLVRRGSAIKVGKSVEDFHPEHIGIRFNSQLVFARYFFYVMQQYHSQGVFEKMAKGSFLLVHITVDDVGALKAHPT